MAETPSAFRGALRSYQLQLAESHRTMVCRVDQQAHPPWFLLQRRGSNRSHQRVPRRLEREAQAVHLDRHRRVNPSETRPLPPNLGADPARLHPPAIAQTKVQLIRGRYTSVPRNTVPSDATTPIAPRT